MKIISRKRIMALTLPIILLFQTTSFAYYNEPYSVGEPDMSTWYAWEPQDDKAAYGTAIDASIWLDAPAGKHGHVKADGDDIYFEDGTPVKFWGTNVVHVALFKDKEEAEWLADRIARSGYNLVRFHHMELQDWGNILGNATQNKELIADSEQLDKMQYFFYLLKERGVYITADLLNRVPYKEESDPTYKNDPAPDWKMDYKWNEDAIEAAKEYLRSIWGVVNPYTGMTMAEDPALVFVNIFNESSVNLGTSINTSTLPNGFKRSVLKRWNEWLLEKYGSTEELKKAWTQEDRKKQLAENERLEYGTVQYQGDTDRAGFMKLDPSDKELEDLRAFNYDLQVDIYIEYRDFFKNELGFKGFMSGVGAGGGAYDDGGGNMTFAAMEQQSNLFDIYDTHVYKSHPYGGGAYNDPNSGITSWTSTVSENACELAKGVVNQHVYNMPQFVSEWNVCSPGPHAAEGQIFMAANSVLHNWNPIHFCLMGEENLEKGKEYLTGFFSIVYGADQISMLPAASSLFYRGDIKELEEQYYMPWSHEEVMSPYLYGKYPHGFEHMWGYYNAGTALMDSPRSEGYEPDTEAMERAVEKYIKNTPQTDEVFWNDDLVMFKVDTDYANVVTGFIGKKKFELSYSTIEYENYAGVAAITSATKETLKDSDSILVTLMSKSRNTGEKLNEDGFRHLLQGTTPVLVEPIVAGITIKTTDDIKVYALSHSGKREKELAVEKLPNGYSYFKADGNVYKTPYYEIVKGEK